MSVVVSKSKNIKINNDTYTIIIKNIIMVLLQLKLYKTAQNYLSSSILKYVINDIHR